MKKIIIACISVLAIAVFAFAAVYNENNFSTGGRMYQQAPEGHLIGQDNGSGSGLHHPGEDCGACHRVGGRAESHLWTMAGTLYKDRSACSVVKQGEIIMEDRDGNIISMTSNEAGNFWTKSLVVSDPYTVSNYHGHEPFVPMYEEDEEGNLIQPADPDNANTWRYKTWIRNGNSLRPMLMVAGVGGSSARNRMSCNMHHGGVAHRAGGLWVCEGSTLPSYPAYGLSYRKHIYPILRSKCSPCHIPGKTKSSVNTKTDLPEFGADSTCIEYSGDFDLMTYEGSTVKVPKLDEDGNVIPDEFEIYDKMGISNVVNTNISEQSTLLLKTVSDGTLHAGGVFWNHSALDYIALKQWIAEGALKN